MFEERGNLELFTAIIRRECGRIHSGLNGGERKGNVFATAVDSGSEE